MLNTLKFTERQQAVIRAAKKYFNRRDVVSRKELHEFMKATYGIVSSPQFITKNLKCKVKGEIGMYRLPPLK